MTDAKTSSSHPSAAALPHQMEIKPSSSYVNPVKAEPISIDSDQEDVKPSKDELDPTRVAKAKVRYEEDLKKHHYEPPAAARIQDE